MSFVNKIKGWGQKGGADQGALDGDVAVAVEGAVVGAALLAPSLDLVHEAHMDLSATVMA